MVDGRQRNTSLSLLLTDEKMLQKAEMEIKDIMEYKIVVITAHDLTFQDLLLWFKKLNSGVRLAPIVKARSNLSAPLTDAILEISRQSGHHGLERGGSFNRLSANLITMSLLL